MLSAALSGGFSGCPQLAEMGIGAGGWEGGDRQEDVPRSSTSQRLAFIFQQENKSPMTGLGSGMPGSGREPGPPPPGGQAEPALGRLEGRHARLLQTPEKIPVGELLQGISWGVPSEENAGDGPVSLVFTLTFNQQKEQENRIFGVTQWSSMVTPETICPCVSYSTENTQCFHF